MKSRLAKSCVCCGSQNLKKSPAILMPFISDRVFDWKPVEINDSWGLNTISNGMAYSICNSLLCQACQHLFLDIRFDDLEMKKLYEGYREEQYTNLREKYEPGYKEKNECLNLGNNYLAEIESFLSPYLKEAANILDWGGDSGENTPFKSTANLIHIYDISEKQTLPPAIKVNEKTLCKTHYDLIVCSHVLEHIPYPLDILKAIKKIIDNDSILYIELPYENFIRNSTDMGISHELKNHWHEHINFFNEKSIEMMIGNVGFKVLELNKLKVSAETCDYVFQVICQLNVVEY